MFNNYKEIVTKTIISKAKKEFINNYEINCDKNIDTVLGCFVINHKVISNYISSIIIKS